MNHYKNNESLAALGQGKWKSALGHTLLIIGMVLVSMGAFAQTPTGGLYMNKEWQPDTTDPTGSRGNIRLETFVTGEKIITESHIPSDIVVVLDQSGSMTQNNMGNKTRLQALKDALEVFIDSIQADAKRYGCDHRMAVVGFATGNHNGNGTSYFQNTEILSTASVVPYRSNAGENPNISVANYRDALVPVAVGNSPESLHVNSRLTTATGRLEGSGGTEMQYGLRLAYEILANRDTTQFNAGTEANPKMIDRSQVVVFFTDGYPGLSFPSQGDSGDRFAQYNPNYNQANTNYIAQTTSDATVIQARNIKNLGAKVFSVGVFDGANPDAAYITTQKAYRGQNGNGTVRYYYWEPQTLPSGQESGDAAANGLMHFISSEYSAAETSSNTPWSTLTVSNDGRSGDYYYSASSPEDLARIFTAIAQESGGSAVPMGEGTIVQDVISPSFQLNIPEGVTDTSSVIKAYAPKCDGKDASGNFTFEDETEGDDGRLILNENGVVQDVEGHENRLPDGIVNYDKNTKTITFTNFNFEEMFVAQEKDNQGHLIEGQFTGRKLVMLIPLEIGDGSWGDGIETNGPLSVIKPDGDTVQANWLAFNRPTANVLGSVWTEVITTPPTGFPEVTGTGEDQTVEIDSPEDLAWFISEVNGRIGYNVKDGVNTNKVASHPKLNGKLTADIDMSRHNWVPIGCGWQVEIDPDSQEGLTRFKEVNGQKVHMVYEGTFDGNGHVITGLKNNASKYYKQIEGNQGAVVVFPGMFSDVKGTVKNVFVLDADFRGKHHDEHFVHHGIIADTLSEGGTIFNCEAAGRITCNNDPTTIDGDSQLIYGGLVGLNEGTIHSCMAMVELTGYTMGGMIGENRGSFSNGFTNGVYNYLDNNITAKYAGGIAAENSGTISNCYVRFERNNQNLNKVVFGQITGTAANYTNCYSPEDLMGKVPTSSTPGNRTYKSAEPAQWIRPFYHDNTLDNTRDKMVDKLNDGVTNGQASWKRTTAGGYLRSPNGGNINGDYPVLAFLKFNETDTVTCLGSADGIRIDYATSLNDMLHRHNNGKLNENTQINNEFTANNANYYKVSGHEAIYKGTINLYANDDVTLPTTGGSKDGEVADNSTAEGVVVYIDEDVSLLQDASSTINAFTGQSMTVYGGDWQDTQAGDRWHNVSSSLQNSGFGWTYSNNGQVAYSDAPRPCGHTLDQSNDDVDIFPTDLGTYHQTDFYCFFEPQYHWINFRRNGQSHWHMDYTGEDIPQNHAHIDYYYNQPSGTGFTEVHDNETQFIPGKGYLLAINAAVFDSVEYKGSQLLQNYGTLNNGDISIPVTYTAANEWTGLAGYNLLGNPYQSYLDFTTFAWANSSLWNDATEMTYVIYDPSVSNYVQGTAGAQPSQGAMAATGDINMHQGFFIKASQTGPNGDPIIATFTNDMRSNKPASGTHFRGNRPNYPLVNLICTDATGNADVAVLEVGRPENGGAKKLRMGSATGHISLRNNNKNFGILFSEMTQGSQPLYFDADEDGMFTLSWNTANADFRELTLVDNITGVRYDMLSHDHYVFEGHANDYRSRFKIVIGSFTGLEEEETVTNNFAFFDGSEWVVNGQGRLTVTDMMGRTVFSANLENDQNRVNLNGVAQGMYLMQVSNSDGSRVQKIVVR